MDFINKKNTKSGEYAQAPLLDGVCKASDFGEFYRGHKLGTTRARIDFLAKTLEISVSGSERYVSDSELLKMLETQVLSYPICR